MLPTPFSTLQFEGKFFFFFFSFVLFCVIFLSNNISFSAHRHHNRASQPQELPEDATIIEHEFLMINSSDWSNETSYHVSSGGEKILSRRKREIPCKKGKRLNNFVDNLLRFAQDSIVPGQLPLMLENVTIDLPEYNLMVFLYNGMISQINGIKRKGKAWVYCQNETSASVMSIGLPVKTEDIRITYKYRLIKDWKLVYDGDAEIQVIHAKTQIQITQYQPNTFEEFPQQRLEAIRIWSIGMVRVMLRGLGNLTSALSMILTSWLNNNLDYIFPMIKDRVESVLLIRGNDYIVRQPLPLDLVGE